MEGHVENRSDKNDLNAENQTFLNFKKSLFVTTRGSIKWVGNLALLKEFVDDLLSTESKWQSRGGYKQYESPSLVIRWYTANKSLTFNGSKSEDLKIKIRAMIEENAEERESDESEVQVSDSVEDTFPTENNMAVEESTDNHPNLTLLNGASILCTTEHDNNVTEKLKMVESQMNQKIEALAYEIQKLKDNKDATTLHAEYVHTENVVLKKENEALRERVQNLGYIMSDLNTKVKDLENEKMSLITVINILRHEHGRDDKRCEGEQCDKFEKKTQEKGNVVIVDDDENVSTHNRYEILSDHQEDNEITSTSHDTNESAKTKSRKSQGGKDKSRNKKRNKASTSTVIIGDSMIKHLDSRRLQRSIKGEESKVFAETYRGAKISAIKHHIKPCLDKTQVILHVGTNDLPEKHPNKIVDGIAEICDIIQTDSPTTEIVISEVILRTDRAEYKQKIGETNTLLASFCESRNLYIIKHNNIGEPHINPYGVHLNRAGTSVLARNILDYLNMHGKSN